MHVSEEMLCIENLGAGSTHAIYSKTDCIPLPFHLHGRVFSPLLKDRKTQGIPKLT